MNRKRMLIKKAQAAIARQYETMDYETRELCYQIRHMVRNLSDEQLARIITNGLSKEG